MASTGTVPASRLPALADWTRLSQDHEFVKPNDERALQLMDHAARDIMHEFKDIVLAFGESDEYRCVWRPCIPATPTDAVLIASSSANPLRCTIAARPKSSPR